MHDTSSNNAGKAAAAVFMVVLTSVYFLAIGSCIGPAADGRHLDWAFILWSAVIGGVIVGLIDYILFRFILLSPSTDEMEEEVLTSATAPITVTFEVNIATPYRTGRPFLHRNDQLLLVGAVVAGLIGGLLAVVLLKRGDKKPS